MDSATTTKTLQALSTGVGLTFAGFSFAASYLAIEPIIALSPTESTSTFAYIFYEGGKFALPACIGGAAFNVACAVRLPRQRVRHSVAAALLLGVLAFTRIVMFPGITRMISISKMNAALAVTTADEVASLLRAWKWQNYARAIFGLVAGTLSTIATFAN